MKYEDIYVHNYGTAPELISGLTKYFHFYNHERYHQSLNDMTPASVYH